MANSSGFQRAQHQGKPLLTTMAELAMIGLVDEHSFGTRELRAKVNGQAGLQDISPPNRLSVFAQWNYGSKSIEIMRTYLDSGVLDRFMEEKVYPDAFSTTVTSEKYKTDLKALYSVAACAMTIGCKLSPELREHLDRLLAPASVANLTKDPLGRFQPLALAQLKHGLANYQEGQCYDFGNETWQEARYFETYQRNDPEEFSLIRKCEVTNVGFGKLLTLTYNPDGLEIEQCMTTAEDIQVEHGLKKIYPNHLCANCGKDRKPDGKKLDRYSKCQDRSYCSKACQKEHWKFPKIICNLPSHAVQSVMAVVPANYDEDRRVTEEARARVRKGLRDRINAACGMAVHPVEAARRL